MSGSRKSNAVTLGNLHPTNLALITSVCETHGLLGVRCENPFHSGTAPTELRTKRKSCLSSFTRATTPRPRLYLIPGVPKGGDARRGIGGWGCLDRVSWLVNVGTRRSVASGGCSSALRRPKNNATKMGHEPRQRLRLLIGVNGEAWEDGILAERTFRWAHASVGRKELR